MSDRGVSKIRQKIFFIFQNTLASLAAAAMIILTSPSLALALDPLTTPTGEVVIGGSANFDRPAAGQLNITQSTNRAVIEWQNFDIGSNAKTEFFQPSTSSIAVNRVVGGGVDPTRVMGTLKSNGTVMILDHNGVLFGQTSIVDVGGIIATTGQIDDAAFLNTGLLNITNVDTGRSVENYGDITIQNSGLAAFVAPHIKNAGTIIARTGTVELAAHNNITVDLTGDGLIELSVNNTEVSHALVENSGSIVADGGLVRLSAAMAEDIVDHVINMDGYIQAQVIDDLAGGIVLQGGNTGTVYVNGTLNTSSTQGNYSGGTIALAGQRIELDQNSYINTTGQNERAGYVLIGQAIDHLGIETAKHVSVAEGSQIHAEGIDNAHGGVVMITASDTTDFSGTIYAMGGPLSGDGGFVEISGHKSLGYYGLVDTSAANGHMGTLHLDPDDIIISNAPSMSGEPSFIRASDLATTLTFSNVLLEATNSITVSEDVDTSPGFFGGISGGDITFTTTVFNLNGDFTFGTGSIEMNANTANLSGRFFNHDGALLDGSRLNSANTATTGVDTVNVLSNQASIQQALDLAKIDSDGSLINVSNGIYSENINFNAGEHTGLTLNGNISNLLNAPVLTAASGSEVIKVEANNVTIQGFVVDGANIIQDGISTNNADNVMIDANRVTGFTRDGIALRSSGFATVQNNFISDSNRYGIFIASGSDDAIINENIIGANLFESEALNGILTTGIGQDGIRSSNADNLTIRHNIITGTLGQGTGRDGIHVNGGTNVTIFGNATRGGLIGVGTGRNGIHVINADNVDIDNNRHNGTFIAWGSRGDAIFVDNSTNVDVTNNKISAQILAIGAQDDGIHIQNSDTVLVEGNKVQDGALAADAVVNFDLNLQNNTNLTVNSNDVQTIQIIPPAAPLTAPPAAGGSGFSAPPAILSAPLNGNGAANLSFEEEEYN